MSCYSFNRLCTAIDIEFKIALLLVEIGSINIREMEVNGMFRVALPLVDVSKVYIVVNVTYVFTRKSVP